MLTQGRVRGQNRPGSSRHTGLAPGSRCSLCTPVAVLTVASARACWMGPPLGKITRPEESGGILVDSMEKKRRAFAAFTAFFSCISMAVCTCCGSEPGNDAESLLQICLLMTCVCINLTKINKPTFLSTTFLMSPLTN